MNFGISTIMPWFDDFRVIGVLSDEIIDDDKHNIFHRNMKKLLGKEW